MITEALLRDIVTGEVAWYVEDSSAHPEHPWAVQAAAMTPEERYHHARYLWLEGNNACDCNRSTFLWLSGPGPPLTDPRLDSTAVDSLLCNRDGNTIVLESLRVDGIQVLEPHERGAERWWDL